MTIQRKLDRSWLIAWAFCALVIAVAIGLVQVDKAVAEEPGVPAFRIVDVRAEQGQLAVEAQHFYPDGSHWFYNLYTWQGREEYNHPRVLNEDGELLLEDESIAPYNTNDLGETYQYIGYSKVHFEKVEENASTTYKVVYVDNAYGNLDLDLLVVGSTQHEVLQVQGEPERKAELVWEYRNGADWKRHDYPFLNETSILQTISKAHKTRVEFGWSRDRGRTVLPYSTHSLKDASGAEALVERFEGLAWILVELGLTTYPPFEMRYDRIYTPKTFTIDGQEYPGEVSNLATILQEFERIDLRTENSKTYELGNLNRRTEFKKAVHYQTSEGEWETSSLRFLKVVDEDIWLMATHPIYNVYGTLNHISMVSPEGEAGARWYTPSQITYQENTAWYEHEGLRWTYTLSPSGIKLTSEVTSPRGPKEYPFVFLPLGETNPLRIDESGNATTVPEYDLGDLGPDAAYFYYEEYADEITGPEVVVPKAVIIGADGEYYSGGDWEIVDDYTIKFAFDDDILPVQAFPYVIDPTTTFKSSASTTVPFDCNVSEDAMSKPWSYYQTTQTAAASNTEATHRVYISSMGSAGSTSWKTFSWGLHDFDTSTLPDDALIISARFGVVSNYVQQTLVADRGMAIVGQEHASASVCTTADWSGSILNFGTDEALYSNPYPLEDIKANDQSYNYFELNGRGLNAVDPQGITGIGIANYSWVVNEEPTGNCCGYPISELSYRSADYSTSSKHPIFEVTYSYTSLFACPSSTETFILISIQKVLV